MVCEQGTPFQLSNGQWQTCSSSSACPTTHTCANNVCCPRPRYPFGPLPSRPSLIPSCALAEYVCAQSKVIGTCQQYSSRYFYNSQTGECEQFTYRFNSQTYTPIFPFSSGAQRASN